MSTVDLSKAKAGSVVNDSCPVCQSPVYAEEGYYSINMAHYSCQFPEGRKVVSWNLSTNVVNAKPKKTRAALGDGYKSRKLKKIITASAVEQFKTLYINDLTLYLPSPVWRQFRFDVARVEGSFNMNGNLCTFSSYICVSELIKFKRLTFISVSPCMYYLTTDTTIVKAD